jgi:hypothetical protein
MLRFDIHSNYDANLDAVIKFEQQLPYVQETVHPIRLEVGANQYFLSPTLTGQAGDGAVIAVSKVGLYVAQQKIWELDQTFRFRATDTVPILIKRAASGDGWVHFLIAACITPDSPGVVGLANEVRALWRSRHPSEAWRAARYTDRDAQEVSSYLREILRRLLVPEGVYVPTEAEDDGVVQHAMRLPDEILSNGGANCLYYSLMYASVLENLGIHPLLLFIPGHVMPGWKTSSRVATEVFSAGKSNIMDPEYFAALDRSTVFLESTRTSFDDSFDELLRLGRRRYEGAKGLARNMEPVYLLDVVEARRRGFSPYSDYRGL